MSCQEKLSNLRKMENSRDPKSDRIRVRSMGQRSVGYSNYVDKLLKDTSIDEIFSEGEFLKLPSQIFNPYRLLILSILWRWGSLDFPALRDGIQIKTDGNLANHLRVLEDLELITYKKEFVDRRPKTFYELTVKGKSIFRDIQLNLLRLLEDSI